MTGLRGSGLVLRLNGTEDVLVPASGPFAFTTRIAAGAPYLVTVALQPATPSQTCSVASGQGTMGAADLGIVLVTCSVDAYAVGGTVSGLQGRGLVLRNNGNDDLPVLADGTFAFPAKVASGAGYSVTVAQQPTGPAQSCTVSTGSGTVGGAAVGSVAVRCDTNAFAIPGVVTGLSGAGLTLAMSLDGGPAEELVIRANGAFAFTRPGLAGSTYLVTVKSQPTSPWQTCAVSGGTGVMSGPVAGLAVSCTTNLYLVGGTVSGLAGTGLQAGHGRAGGPGGGARRDHLPLHRDQGQRHGLRRLGGPAAGEPEPDLRGDRRRRDGGGRPGDQHRGELQHQPVPDRRRGGRAWPGAA